MRCIRPLCEADVDAVVRLEEASFHTPWTRADFEGELENPLALYLVVLEDDELIAYGGSWIVFDECHITNIAVTPSMRRRKRYYADTGEDALIMWRHGESGGSN